MEPAAAGVAAAPAATPTLEGPVQIIHIPESGDRFTLEEDRLNYVLRQCPPNAKVAVVSVVGAFRKGKSFLLSLILRYLRFRAAAAAEAGGLEASPPGSAPWLSGQDAILEGHVTTRPDAAAGADAEALPAPDGRAGFKWRRGEERMTTGIWLWSRPFMVPLPGGDGEEVAVLLMDTQGMYDSRTSAQLTTAIFALSTLMSSYQVFNIMQGVQENYLDELASFSAYADAARRGQQRTADDGASSSGDVPLLPERSASSASAAPTPPPFQHLDFLVRDSGTVTEFLPDPAIAGGLFPADAAEWAEVDGHCQKTLDQFMADKLPDGTPRPVGLAVTRAQVRACFARLTLHMLPSPGNDVVQARRGKEFSGELDKVSEEFRALVQRYVEELFERSLQAKTISGRPVTAQQLRVYIVEYCRLFRDRVGMPEGGTVLEATTRASNTNARATALRAYRESMDSFCRQHRADAEIERHHVVTRAASLSLFDEKANFGPPDIIRGAREEFEAELKDALPEALARNRERNPWRVVGPFLTAAAAVLFAWVLRQLLELTCAPWLDVCRQASQLFAFVYSAVLLGLLGIAYVHWRSIAEQFTAFTPLVQQLVHASGGGGVLVGTQQRQQPLQPEGRGDSIGAGAAAGFEGSQPPESALRQRSQRRQES